MVINGRVSAVGKRVSGSIGGNGAVDGNVEKADNIYVKETEFKNRYEFPSIGKDKVWFMLPEK